jgi:hypothetical protein
MTQLTRSLLPNANFNFVGDSLNNENQENSMFQR